MAEYNQEKCLVISQSISAIYDHADASATEACSATALALRVVLDNEPDKFLRAFLLTTVIKHLTMDHKKEAPVINAIELIRPN